MKRVFLALSFSLTLCLTLSLAPMAVAQVAPRQGAIAPAATTKRPIRHSDYDSWRSIVGTTLSRDGKWLLYAIQPYEGDGEIVVRSTAIGGPEYKIPRGGRGQFSVGGKWVILSVAPTKADVEAARKDKKPAPTATNALLNLSNGKVETLEKVQRVDFPAESETFLFIHKEAEKPAAGASASTPFVAATPPVTPRRNPAAASPVVAAQGTPPAAPRAGTELVIREMATGKSTPIADVVSYIVTEDGKQLLYVVRGKEEAKNGVYVRDLATGTDTILSSTKGEYTNLTWERAGTRAAFAFVPAPPTPPKDAPKETTAKDATPEVPKTPQVFVYEAKTKVAKEIALTPPSGLVVAETPTLRFDKSGELLFIPLAKKPAVPRPKDAPDPINVDLWNWKDGLLQPMQKVRAEAEKRRTYAAAYRLADSKLVPLATPDLPTVRVDNQVSQYLLASTDLPYQQLSSWDTGYDDFYLLDIKTGERRKVLEKQSGGVQLSPDEKHLLWWDGKEKAWMLKGTEKDSVPRNITGKLSTSFAQEDWDTPGDPAPYGVMGWTRDGKSLLLYDRFDIWQVILESGIAKRVTEGRLYDTIFRYVKLETGRKAEEPGIPTDTPLTLSALNDSTKATGYWRLTNLTANGYLEKIGMWDKKIGELQQAQESNTIVFTQQKFSEFPDLWLAPDLTKMPTAATRITDANPQAMTLIGGRSELIEYTNNDGKTLRAILTKPENFDPNKQYPLMVYIYEELTNGLHTFIPPRPGTSINPQRYVSNGYILLQPDITYTAGYPGEDAEKCVLPAIQTVLRQGYIDPKRVGIQGHSWGAFQITHLITRTNLFRAVEAGASVSNMVSAYGGIRWETGMSRAFQYEKTQSRIGGTPWSKPMQFLENSPIFWADKVQTPYLALHNDADGAVPWQEGIAFFTALRRLGKEAYMFNYNGEGHGITGRENQKHWTVHMAEFFDHYLLNTPRPEWMDKGVPYLERGTRDLSPFYSPSPPAPLPR
jgi:dipeptidyl aminopeptidase/acylaminoacyl peptidase